MDLRDIDYFVAVAEHGHLGRAAEKLGIGQPALSVSLRRLEREAGAPLAVRTARGVVLTEVGSALLQRARKFRLAREDFHAAVSDFSQGRLGTINLGMSAAMGELLGSKACVAFNADYPSANLRIFMKDYASLVRDLISGHIHLAVFHSRKRLHHDITEIRICSEEMVVYCSSRHRLAKQKTVTLADLSREQWATTSAGASDWLQTTFQKEGFLSPQLTILADSMNLKFKAISASSLIGIGAKHVIAQADRKLGLTILPYCNPEWLGTVSIGIRKDGYLPPTAERFIETLKETAKECGLT